MTARARKTVLALAAALAALAAAGAAHAQPALRRTLPSYFVLAQRKASLKNLSLDSACNVGVNCPSPNQNSSCGGMALDAVTFVDGSQTVADKVYFRKPGAVVSQLCRNGGGPLTNVTITAPPPEPFETSLLPDTCGKDCKPDHAALETLCDFPVPFPACESEKFVAAVEGADCAFDAEPGNRQCDLAPGAYGLVYVQNRARLTLGPGTYVMCGFRAGRHATVRARATTVLIPSGGFFKLNNGTTLAQSCGDVTVLLKGKGRISFGRHSSVAASVCAPESSIKLGHANRLLGRFVGDTVNADRDNHALCCTAGACACFDDFTPRAATEGATVTLLASCDLRNVTAARVCGIPAPILARTATELMLTIPPGAAGPCPIEVASPAGTFAGAIPIAVN